MNLSRSFLILYILMAAIFGAFGWLLYQFWNIYAEQDVEYFKGYKTVLVAVNENLENMPHSQWQGYVESAKQRYTLPLQLVADANVEEFLPNFKYVKGKRAFVHYGDNDITLLHPIANQDEVLILGPIQSSTRIRTEALVSVAIVLLLGFTIVFWVWPISRDVGKLTKSAKEFEYGDFRAKVDPADTALVQPVMSTFNMMASKINNLIEAHKELTNAVSHELRTPLARSKFALQVLRGAKDEITRKEYIEKITCDLEELESLVNELLVYAAFESEQPNINFIYDDVKQLVDFQVASFAKHVIDINFDCSQQTVMAEYDAHFINRAFSNLLTNAIKFGQGKLQVSLISDGKQCTLSVEDNGLGVDDDFKEIIFDAFSRYDKSRAKDTGGFGLGLAIVSKIMFWHKGTAKVENSALGGAKFILSWPVKHLAD